MTSMKLEYNFDWEIIRWVTALEFYLNSLSYTIFSQIIVSMITTHKFPSWNGSSVIHQIQYTTITQTPSKIIIIIATDFEKNKKEIQSFQYIPNRCKMPATKAQNRISAKITYNRIPTLFECQTLMKTCFCIQ